MDDNHQAVESVTELSSYPASSRRSSGLHNSSINSYRQMLEVVPIRHSMLGSHNEEEVITHFHTKFAPENRVHGIILACPWENSSLQKWGAWGG